MRHAPEPEAAAALDPECAHDATRLSAEVCDGRQPETGTALRSKLLLAEPIELLDEALRRSRDRCRWGIDAAERLRHHWPAFGEGVL